MPPLPFMYSTGYAIFALLYSKVHTIYALPVHCTVQYLPPFLWGHSSCSALPKLSIAELALKSNNNWAPSQSYYGEEHSV